MSIADQINSDIKSAMKAKDKDRLNALRAVKSALLLAGTEKGSGGDVSDEEALKILQKLVKQRKESAEMYQSQNREDLAKDELDQAAVIEAYLPQQLGEEEIRVHVKTAIEKTGASGPQDMGKVMGILMKDLAGKADGKVISKLVKEEL